MRTAFKVTSRFSKHASSGRADENAHHYCLTLWVCLISHPNTDIQESVALAPECVCLSVRWLSSLQKRLRLSMVASLANRLKIVLASSPQFPCQVCRVAFWRKLCCWRARNLHEELVNHQPGVDVIRGIYSL